MASQACAEILKRWRSEMLKRALIVFAVVEFIVTVLVMFYVVKR